MANDKQNYRVKFNKDGTADVTPVSESDPFDFISILVYIGMGIVWIWERKPLRYAIIIIFAGLFVAAIIMTAADYINPGIPVTDLVMTDSANVIIETNSDNYDYEKPQGTYLKMTSYIDNEQTVVAHATFQNQENLKNFYGTVDYLKPSHVEQSAIFRIYTDGVLAYDSGELGKDIHAFEIDVDDVSEIRIEAHCTYSELNYYGETVYAVFYFDGELKK